MTAFTKLHQKAINYLEDGTFALGKYKDHKQLTFVDYSR